MAARVFPTEVIKLSITKPHQRLTAKRLNLHSLRPPPLTSIAHAGWIFAFCIKPNGFFLTITLCLLSSISLFRSEHCTVVFGQSTPRLPMWTVSSGSWIWVRQGFAGSTAAPCLHPQGCARARTHTHTNTLSCRKRSVQGGASAKLPPGSFVWVHLYLSVINHSSLMWHFTSAEQPPASFIPNNFACILQSLAIPAPVRCNIYAGETFQWAGCLSCSVTEMSFRLICHPDFNHHICFSCYIPRLFL